MQPHCVQSGVPPNRQDVTRFFKSAVSESVVRAEMHSAGECGGLRYPSVACFGITSFGYAFPNSEKCASSAGLNSITDEQTHERATGFGDARVGFQVVAFEDAPGRPGLAFAYYVELPTADEERSLGTGSFDHKIVGLVSKKLGVTDVDFNVGYLLVGGKSAPGLAARRSTSLTLTYLNFSFIHTMAVPRTSVTALVTMMAASPLRKP